MLDNPLIALLISTIIAGEAVAGIAGTPLKQAFQPTNQGVNSGPTAYMYKIGDELIGSPWRGEAPTGGDYLTENNDYLTTEAGDNLIEETDEVLVHTEIQQYATTFQISTLSTQDPANTTQYTASDILNLIRSILQSDATISTLNDNDVGILRVDSVRNTPFIDDRNRNEYSPSMDFTVTHHQIINSISNAVSSFELTVDRV